MSALDVLGKNYGRAKGWRTADCIHVLAPGVYHTTLCGEGVATVAHVCSLDSGYKPGGGAGCWTCLEESNRWAKREVSS